MNSFTRIIIDKCFTMATSVLLERIAENKGYFKNLKPIERISLDRLHKQAIIFSAESSNRIENIVVERNRLAPLLEEGSCPKSRSEEEVLGYKNALKHIFENNSSLKFIDQNDFKYFHKLCQRGSIDSIGDDAGELKVKNNNIYEELKSGELELRFKTVAADDSKRYFDQLDVKYEMFSNQEIPILILISLYILDFLCIHPFRDGNGRVSRLGTVALLMLEGYQVCKYISIEKIIEQRLDEYYEVLKKSSENWHDSKHDPVPWVMFFLSVLNEAYRDIKDKTNQLCDIRDSEEHLNKREIVISTIKGFRGKFTRGELEKACPNISSSSIKDVLSELKDKEIELIGKGRGAYWIKMTSSTD